VSDLSAEKIVRKAIKRGELDLLLLGRPEYRFLPKWSPATGSDIIALLSGLYGLVGQFPREE
jgi:hypothetical protein